MNWTRILFCCVAMTAMLSIALTGCTPHKETPKTDAGKKIVVHPDKGPRGGSLADWGEDEYHVEYTVDTASKSAVVYICNGELVANKVVDGINVAADKITDVKLAVVDPKLEIDLKHDAKRSIGKAIAFSGTNAAFGDAKAAAFKGTVSGKVDGKPVVGEFPLKPGH